MPLGGDWLGDLFAALGLGAGGGAGTVHWRQSNRIRELEKVVSEHNGRLVQQEEQIIALGRTLKRLDRSLNERERLDRERDKELVKLSAAVEGLASVLREQGRR